jgi:hypothetical protein
MMIKLPSTAHFVVAYDDSLTGSAVQWSGKQLAQNVLDHCEYDYARLSALFGVTLQPANLPIAVNIVASGGGGGSNDGLAAIPGGYAPTITLNVGPNNIYAYPEGICGLLVIEEAEIFMVVQNNGWNLAWSAGEALSRVCSQILYPESAATAATGSDWFNPSTHTNPVDWIDNVEPSDLDFVSIGCGSLFLNFLAYQLNYTWPAIIGAGAPSTNTLAETATILGATQDYAAFLALLQSNFPTGDLYPAATPFDQRIDDVYPLGPLPTQLPSLYMRHNTADDGTSHSPPLSNSPDIIMKNAQVANPQATFSTPASIASANESDASVRAGRTNYLYLRVWNRGTARAKNVFASVYWSPPATLITPSMWSLIGTSYYPDVPTGSMVEVTTLGIPWPADQIPMVPRPLPHTLGGGRGHYCFIATVGNNYQPAPNPETLSAFSTFQDHYNYILNNNNITWRNFNVVPVRKGKIGLISLPFHITGAGIDTEIFALETIADLPIGSTLAIQVADWIGHDLRPAVQRFEAFQDFETDIANTHRQRLPLPTNGAHVLGEIALPAHTAAASHLLVELPREFRDRAYDVIIRQLYRGEEVGRVTWKLLSESGNGPASKP